MGLFDGCLLACDIDGTLMTDGYINPKNTEKIEYFMSEGGCFSLSTGRSIGAVSDVLAALNRVSPSVVANGCMLYDFENKKMLYDVTLPEEDYKIAKAVYDLGLDVGIEIHCGENVYTLRKNAATDLHQLYEKFTAEEISFEEAYKLKWHKAIYMLKSEEDRQAIKDLIAKQNTKSSFFDTCASINGEIQLYHEQVASGVSKAAALERLCELLNIKKGGFFAIGDYYNDIPMLKAADISASPCDSPEEIKKLSDFTAVSCSNGAVADFIDYLTSLFCGKTA